MSPGPGEPFILLPYSVTCSPREPANLSKPKFFNDVCIPRNTPASEASITPSAVADMVNVIRPDNVSLNLLTLSIVFEAASFAEAICPSNPFS